VACGESRVVKKPNKDRETGPYFLLLHFEKLRPIIPTMTTEGKGQGQGGSTPVVDVENQPRTQEIVLASSLTMDSLTAKAGRRFQANQFNNETFPDGRTGSGLRLIVDDGFTIRPEILRFIPRDPSRSYQGFSIDEGKLDHNLRRAPAVYMDRMAVIFDHSNGSVTFVDPRVSDDTVSGLRIAANLGATKFFGPTRMFKGEISTAKEMAKLAATGQLSLRADTQQPSAGIGMERMVELSNFLAGATGVEGPRNEEERVLLDKMAREAEERWKEIDQHSGLRGPSIQLD